MEKEKANTYAVVQGEQKPLPKGITGIFDPSKSALHTFPDPLLCSTVSLRPTLTSEMAIFIHLDRYFEHGEEFKGVSNSNYQRGFAIALEDEPMCRS